MALLIGLNVYMEERLLEGCLQSIKKAAPHARLVAVDGCYQSWVAAARRVAARQIDNGHDVLADQTLALTSPRSTDRTLALLKDYGAEVILADQPWEHEFVKRSAYLVGRQGDWYLVLDGDERLMGTVPEDFSPYVDPAYSLMLQRDSGDAPYTVLRMFRHHASTEYRGAHHAIHLDGAVYHKKMVKTVGHKTYEDVEYMRPFDRCKGEPFWIHHLHEGRGEDRIRAEIRGEYYHFLVGKEEHEFRLVHNL